MRDIVEPLPQTATVQSYVSNRNYAHAMTCIVTVVVTMDVLRRL